MDRREFCRVFGACTLTAAAGGLTGCARLLDWSEAGTTAAVRRLKPTRAGASGDASATGAPSGETTAPPESGYPDLAYFQGGTPDANVEAALAALGGMGRFVREGDRVLVKPNVLTGRSPEYATTTNPIAVATVVRLALEAGAAQVVVADRPTSTPRTSFEVSGIAPAVSEAGGRVKYLSERDFVMTAIPDGRTLTAWPLLSDVFDADVFINMPIAKTHGLAKLTLSMKNLMGIMGGARGTMHQDFDQKIVDLSTLVRPHLIVLDAYRILVRNGPTGGDLKDVATPKVCIAGTSAVSVDALAASLFDMDPGEIGYLARAAEQGLGVIDLSRLQVLKGSA